MCQWRATCDLNTLWQRFGRAARGFGTEAVAVLLAESKYFDDTKEKVAKAAKARLLKAAERAQKQERLKRASSSANPPAKKQKTLVSNTSGGESNA